MKTKGKYEPTKVVKIVLFWANFLLVVFLSKKIISPPKGSIDFLIQSLLSFVCAIIITGIMIQYSTERVLKISIIIAWIVTILLAIT
jgi:hypothetical protein